MLHPYSVAAYMLGKRGREIATRIWELVPEDGGIIRNCQCEKGDKCRADGMVLRPFVSQEVEDQMRAELFNFASEYRLPPNKIHYNHLSPLSDEPQPIDRFRLTGLWKNEEAITEARDTFARLYWE